MREEIDQVRQMDKCGQMKLKKLNMAKNNKNKNIIIRVMVMDVADFYY